MNYTGTFRDLKKQRELQYEPTCQKDTKKGDKENWGVITAQQDVTWLSLLFVLTKTGRFLSSRSV